MHSRTGTWLVVAGVALLVVTVAGSAALAPSVEVSDGGERRTLVGIQGGGTGWHKYGSVALYEGSEVTWREGSADSYFDVTKLDNGSVMAGFMHSGYRDCGPYDAPCTKTGFRVIDPTGPRVVSEYAFPVRTAKNSEVHDVEALPSGGYLLTDMEHERIFVVENGEVVWQWRAAAFYDAPDDPTTTDWLHINDVDRIGDGRYLVSVRNANQLVVVERGEGVVEVVNADEDDSDDGSCTRGGQLRDTDGDGDVRCGDPDVLDHQHNPQWLGDGHVLVADSDNDRVVELRRTDDGWEPVWTLTRSGGVALNWPRDADRLSNGNTLVTDTLNRRILEVNRSGEVVWSVQTERIPYEADRLPDGETVGAPRYDPEGGVETATGESVPVLSLALVGIRSVAPWLPFWFGELQFAATLASVGLVGAGAVVRYRD